jgi:electron transport complex protein RnfD
MSFSEEAEILMETPMATLVEDFDLIADASWLDLFLGNVPGTIGTISVLAVLLGGAYLIFRRIITWHIPLSFILSAWGFALIFWLIDAEVYAPPTFHVLSGWIMLGAFFLAPEKGTAPVTVPGMILYGMGCGVVTMIIRIWGVHLEGVPFAILLMNALTPLLDRIRPRAVGRVGEIA